MPTTYELKASQEQLLNQLLWAGDNEEEIDKTMRLLESIKGSVTRKVEFVSSLLMEASALEESRSEALKKAKKRHEQILGIQDRLKNYINRTMLDFNLEKVEAEYCTLVMQNNPPSVAGNCDLDRIPEQYVSVIPESKKLNKKALLQDYPVGSEPFSGLAIIQTKSVRIK
ncbi:gp157-like protein [Caudoviricetes sp.]|nr:gp157-like protein [Caudoviricetes sp.]